MEEALHFFILALASYRLQRVITTDDWPPSIWLRAQLALWGSRGHHFRADIAYMMSCVWCAGSWITAGVFLTDWKFNIPAVVWWVLAGAAVVGVIGRGDGDSDDGS